MALNFDEFQKVVESAQQADAIKSDLKRALKKVTGALESLQESLNEMNAMLADDYVAAGRKARKPRTPKAASTDAPAGERKRPGRPKKVAA